MPFQPKAFGIVIVDSLGGLATQSEAERKVKFPENKTKGKTTLNQKFSIIRKIGCPKKSTR